ncbi:MAG: hypothetical protein OSB62_05625 [Alphaproteobacteria bacterium]|nr:hypothetical protein [Alphaproteobacteria bacterium]
MTNSLAQESIKELLKAVSALQNFQTSNFEEAIIKGIALFNEFIKQGKPFKEYLEPFIEGLHKTQIIEGTKDTILQNLPQEIDVIYNKIGYLFWVGVSASTRDAITRFIETFSKQLKNHSA